MCIRWCTQQKFTNTLPGKIHLFDTIRAQLCKRYRTQCKIAKIGNVEIARCENTKGVSCDARECVCMCVRRVRCLWSVSTASVKNRAWNPNWAWLSLIYLVAQRRDKVPARVEVAPLYRQLFSAWNIVSYLCELVRSYAMPTSSN